LAEEVVVVLDTEALQAEWKTQELPPVVVAPGKMPTAHILILVQVELAVAVVVAMKALRAGEVAEEAER
jgi:hypothetical protein